MGTIFLVRVWVLQVVFNWPKLTMSMRVSLGVDFVPQTHSEKMATMLIIQT